MAVPLAEAGHFSTRVYIDQNGVLHLNGTGVVDGEGINLLANYEYAVSPVLAAVGAVSQHLMTFPNDGTSYIVKAASARFTTASASGTAQIEVAGAAVAIGSGTNQLTGAISLAGTANTTVNGVVIASPTILTAGGSLNFVAGGTMTGLVGLQIVVALARVS